MSKHYLSSICVVEDLCTMLRSLDLDKKWIVEVRKRTQKRSTNQNSWLWVCHKVVADDTGNTVDEIHEIVKQELLPKRLIEFDGEERCVDGTTTGLTKDQWSDFMTAYAAWAAQYGIMLPHPEDQGRD